MIAESRLEHFCPLKGEKVLLTYFYDVENGRGCSIACEPVSIDCSSERDCPFRERTGCGKLPDEDEINY